MGDLRFVGLHRHQHGFGSDLLRPSSLASIQQGKSVMLSLIVG